MDLQSFSTRTARHNGPFGQHAEAVVVNGYQVVPIKPGRKDPAAKNWPTFLLSKEAVTEFGHCGIGILTATTPAVDNDWPDPAGAAALDAALLAEFPALAQAPKRTGQAPKHVRLCRAASPFAKVPVTRWKADGAKAHFEVLGEGQQFVAFGRHPVTRKNYQWHEGRSPLTVPAADLPLIDRLVAERMRDIAKGLFEQHGYALDHDPTKAAQTCQNGAEGAQATGDGVYPVPEVDGAHPLALKALRRLCPDQRDLWIAVMNDMRAIERSTRATWPRELWRGWAELSPANQPGDEDKWDERGVGTRLSGLGALCQRAGIWDDYARFGFEVVPDADTCPPDWKDPRQGEVTLQDFAAFMPMHAFIFIPTRQMWPAASVNARIKHWPKNRDGEVIRPSSWLDRHAAVEQMTWAPGAPMLIKDRLVAGGGWLARPGCTTFNLYLPPAVSPGNPNAVEPWLDHVRRLYGDHTDHLVDWLAQRVQAPSVKVNHALVLGGAQGIGKDTLLEPVKYAIGPWNFVEVSPHHLMGRFNGFVKSVVLRVSEARDLGDVDRYTFYDHMKVYTAAPPDVLRVDEKNIKEYEAMNVTGVVITSNHKSDGIYLPADDRRHFVAWSSLTKDAFAPEYWQRIYRWYAAGGTVNVAAFLQNRDISQFDPKAPPPKTDAWHDIVNANRAPEDAELADVLDAAGWPKAITLDTLVSHASLLSGAFDAFLRDRKNRRIIPHRLEGAGYVPIRNPDDRHDGQWRIGGRRQTVYARRELSVQARISAARGLS